MKREILDKMINALEQLVACTTEKMEHVEKQSLVDELVDISNEFIDFLKGKNESLRFKSEVMSELVRLGRSARRRRPWVSISKNWSRRRSRRSLTGN